MKIVLVGFALKVFVSFSPGFSPVLERDRRWLTVLTVYVVRRLQHLGNEVFPGCSNRKTVETVTQLSALLATGLKPGENEMKTFEAEPF